MTFEPFGLVQSIWVAQNPPGYAFVGFENDQDAYEAWKHMDGQILLNRRIKVNASFRSNQRTGFGGGMVGPSGGMGPAIRGPGGYGGGYNPGGMASLGGSGGRYGGYGSRDGFGAPQPWNSGGDWGMRQQFDTRRQQLSTAWPDLPRSSSSLLSDRTTAPSAGNSVWTSGGLGLGLGSRSSDFSASLPSERPRSPPQNGFW